MDKEKQMKGTGFFAEFRKFIARGNVMDMAVGVVVGAAFTAIVNSLVNDIIMPVIGLVTGGIDFQDLQIVLRPATETADAVAIRYGIFINAIISFIIIAFVVFCFVKAINKMKDAAEKKKAEEEAAQAAVPPAPSPEIVLLTEIRDLLKK